MLTEIDLALNYRHSQCGQVAIATNKELSRPKSLYRIEFSDAIDTILPARILYKPQVIVDLRSTDQKDDVHHRVGQLDSLKNDQRFRARLFGETLYKHYLTIEKEQGVLEAKHSTERQVVLTLLHEKFHYITRFLDNSSVMLAFVVIPELSDLLTKARKLTTYLDDEEVYCEFMATREAASINSEQIVSFSILKNILN